MMTDMVAAGQWVDGDDEALLAALHALAADTAAPPPEQNGQRQQQQQQAAAAAAAAPDAAQPQRQQHAPLAEADVCWDELVEGRTAQQVREGIMRAIRLAAACTARSMCWQPAIDCGRGCATAPTPACLWCPAALLCCVQCKRRWRQLTAGLPLPMTLAGAVRRLSAAHANAGPQGSQGAGTARSAEGGEQERPGGRAQQQAQQQAQEVEQEEAQEEELEEEEQDEGEEEQAAEEEAQDEEDEEEEEEQDEEEEEEEEEAGDDEEQEQEQEQEEEQADSALHEDSGQHVSDGEAGTGSDVDMIEATQEEGE
jgi:adenine-specific DNA glycosylase